MNVISFELCAEDRARLDRLIAVQEASAALLQALLESGSAPKAAAPVVPVAEAPAVEAAAPAVEPEAPAAPVAPAKPAVTLAQIQKKATQIAAASETKKAALRALVNRYAAKLSDLPEQAWDEVWAALCALESEA